MGIAEAYVSWVLLTLETISLSYEILWLHVPLTYVTHKEPWDLMWNIVQTGLVSGLEAGWKKMKIFKMRSATYYTWVRKSSLCNLAGSPCCPASIWNGDSHWFRTLLFCSTIFRKLEPHTLPWRLLDKYLISEWKFLLVPMSLGYSVCFILISS